MNLQSYTEANICSQFVHGVRCQCAEDWGRIDEAVKMIRISFAEGSREK